MNLWKRFRKWQEQANLKSDRDMTNRIFGSYGLIRREEELKRLVAKWLPGKHVHSNPPRRLMGKGWGRVKYPTGDFE